MARGRKRRGRGHPGGRPGRRTWQPLRRVPAEALDPDYLRRHPHAGGTLEVWVSDRYECTVLDLRDENRHLRHLSINLRDRRPVRNWRHLLQIKNEICGELWTGIEFFPPEDRLVDAANQYHLCCFPPDVDFSALIGPPGAGLVSDDEQVRCWNAASHPGRQEPWEPGLTTGRTAHSAPSRRRLSEREEPEKTGGD